MSMQRECPRCEPKTQNYSKFGQFIRKCDGRRLQRYRCNHCLKTFSQATTQKCYYQKKRRLNPRIHEDYCAKVSQRRIAKKYRISRTTVARKLIFLGALAKVKNI